MNRESEHAVVALKDCGGAIALMDITIQDQDIRQARILDDPCGYGGIVKDTKTLPSIRIGMVGTAC